MSRAIDENHHLRHSKVVYENIFAAQIQERKIKAIFTCFLFHLTSRFPMFYDFHFSIHSLSSFCDRRSLQNV